MYTLGMNLIYNSREIDDRSIRFWGKYSCKMFGVDVEVSGLESLPPGGCIFLFNHSSLFDIFSMNWALPSFRFGAKIELFKIPIFGKAMRRVGVLPIARHRREEVFKIYEASVERIKSGERIALAPEGTRQKNDQILGPFKAGPFVFAINAQTQLVPVIIKGAAGILPKYHLLPNMTTWKSKITIQILPPISAASYNLKERPALQDKIRDIMKPYFL